MGEVRFTDGAWGRCQRKLPVGGAAKRILANCRLALVVRHCKLAIPSPSVDTRASITRALVDLVAQIDL
jgi:hypothetical protein